MDTHTHLTKIHRLLPVILKKKKKARKEERKQTDSKPSGDSDVAQWLNAWVSHEKLWVQSPTLAREKNYTKIFIY